MKKHLSLLTLVCLVLGVILALTVPELMARLEFIGTYYISILKILSGPVIFTSILVSVYHNSKNKDRLIVRSVITFAVMFVITFLITSMIVTLINPGKGFILKNSEWNNAAEFSLKGMLLNLLPKNLNEIFINPKIFPLIVLAFVIGKISSYFKADRAFEWVAKIRDVIFKILEYVIYVTPLAVMVLIGNTVIKYGDILFGVGIKYIATAWICGMAVLVIVMILPVWLSGAYRPLEFVKKTYRIWLMTVSTCSSAATLPYTLKLCKEDLGIDSKISDVVVPLGCTINMCGGAVSFALLGLFCAEVYGIKINLLFYVMMLVSALLINMAAPGIPGGGIIIGAGYLQLLGIPLGFIGLYSGIYKLLDMCYTSLNVSGDITANILIAKSLKR